MTGKHQQLSAHELVMNPVMSFGYHTSRQLSQAPALVLTFPLTRTFCTRPYGPRRSFVDDLASSFSAIRSKRYSLEHCRTKLTFTTLIRQSPISAKLGIERSQIPNLLTYARVTAIPILAGVGLMQPFYGQYTTLSAVFMAASLTDLLDGYLARKWNAVSPMGIFLDPVADKLIVAVALILLSARFPATSILLSACVTLTREIFVSALREWMAIRQKSAVVKVSIIGKVKTASQLLSLSILLAVSHLYAWYARIAVGLLLLSSLLAIISAIEYVRASVRALQEQ